MHWPGSIHYILVDRVVTPVSTEDPAKLHLWAEWMESQDRHVAQTGLSYCWVSTVFLGMDHSFRSGGPPIVFETMTFWDTIEPFTGGWEQRRCTTWEEAVLQHEAAVAYARSPVAIWAYIRRTARDKWRTAMDQLRTELRLLLQREDPDPDLTRISQMIQSRTYW